MTLRLAAIVAMLSLSAAAPVAAQPILGEDAAACAGSGSPAIRVNITGLKDRIERLKLELYPANEDDFLKDDRDLVKAGKFFHHIWAKTPSAGAVTLCIKAPRSGRYALLFTHDRDGRNKFDFWRDGAGFPGNRKLGRTRPKLTDSTINIGGGVTTMTMRDISGFAPYALGS